MAAKEVTCQVRYMTYNSNTINKNTPDWNQQSQRSD